MRKNKFYRYINELLASMLIIGFICSCSKDNESDISKPNEETKSSLSISINGLDNINNVRSSGNVDNSTDPKRIDETKIYSLEVLIFKPDGSRDAYAHIDREINGTDYKEISEIKDISFTASSTGRDVYVIANASDQFFSTATTLTSFKSKLESLTTQGTYPHPGTVTTSPEDSPIGGVDPSDLKTNLTMIGSVINYSFDNTANHHYLGYATANGFPGGIDPTGGKGAVIGTAGSPFYLERLVARVALKKISFALPTSLTFETGFPTSEYTYHLDTVFLANVKEKSRFSTNADIPTANFGHGDQIGYNFLRTNLTNISTASTLDQKLSEPIYSTSYDITTDDIPLWFYVLENQDTSSPTTFVIGVRYNFKSTKDNKIKTVKCYYPVVVNRPGYPNKPTSQHDYIKRNNQYGLSVTINKIGLLSTSSINELRSTATDLNYLNESIISVEEEVGTNLFS